jgi:hypothetical protein
MTPRQLQEAREAVERAVEKGTIVATVAAKPKRGRPRIHAPPETPWEAKQIDLLRERVQNTAKRLAQTATLLEKQKSELQFLLQRAAKHHG